VTRRIRITYVIDVLDTDLAGTESQLIMLINGLDKTRFEVNLLCFQDHPWFHANRASLECDTTIIDICQFRRLSTYRNIFKLFGHFRRTRPDIVHTFFPVANIFAVVAARLAGVRNVFSSRRDYGEWMSARYLAFTKLANRFVRKIVANSHSVKSLTVEVEKVATDKVVVFYNGIDVTAFDHMIVDWELKQRLKIPKQNKVVGILANFRPMKRHDTFLLAAREVLRVRNDVDFLFVGGGGPMELDTVTMGKTLGIAEKLHFVGSQTNVISYLSIMDVGVNCSEREGLSNAIMEYMAAGVPSIVSQGGGNPDLITHRQHGLTFPLGDYRALADGIIALLDNEQMREEFRLAAKKRTQAELTVAAMLANYEKWYTAMVDTTA
jgi:glycosyltransferase involved in cell wall biosynthesis